MNRIFTWDVLEIEAFNVVPMSEDKGLTSGTAEAVCEGAGADTALTWLGST